jgi:hypothetical protein
VWCILYGQVQLGVAFVIATQCYHGVGQAQTPIYSRVGHEGLRSCVNEYMGLGQPFGPISSQWAKGYC